MHVTITGTRLLAYDRVSAVTGARQAVRLAFPPTQADAARESAVRPMATHSVATACRSARSDSAAAHASPVAQNFLKSKSEPVSGKKADLVERVADWLDAHPTG